MAKRKRLTPAQNLEEGAISPLSETKLSRAPIASVAGDSAAVAALREVSRTLEAARDEGRMVVPVPLDEIREHHLTRDRLPAEDEDMAALRESLRARGQQTPIEVVLLEGGGGYGLISGWRRLTALRRLWEETGEARFAQVQALVRRPDSASDAYVAMVEENEIRVGLSYFERARIAAKAVEQGVFETPKKALLSLYASASRPKRSKIRAFLPVVAALDGALRVPVQLGERLGLELSKALQADPALAARIRSDLKRAAPASAEAEQAIIAVAMKGKRAGRGTSDRGEEIAPGLTLQERGGKWILSGAGLSDDLKRELRGWLATRNSP